MFAIVGAPERRWGSTETLLVGVAGLLALALFVAVQQAPRQPLMRLGIFRTPNLAAANVTQVLLGAAWVPMWFFPNLYLQQGGRRRRRGRAATAWTRGRIHVRPARPATTAMKRG